MSFVFDLMVPGSGAVVDVLLQIGKLCNEMKEGQDACRRMHRRLENLFEELKKMESGNRLPPSDQLEKCAGALGKSLQYLQRYQGLKLFKRLLKHSTIMKELGLIHEEIDTLFQMLNLAGTGTMMDWKQQWEKDQQAQEERFAFLVGNGVEVLREMQSLRAQAEAIMTLQYEIKQRPEELSDKTKQHLNTMMTTIIRASNGSVGKLPDWFLPEDDIKYEPEPFGFGSFASVHRGVWGHGTRVVVKRFLLDDMISDARAKIKMENEMNLWHSFNHPNVIKMYGASHVSCPPIIVCEDAENGDLGSYLATPVNRARMWQLLYAAALGLNYIHSKKVVHGDLKLNNILVTKDGQAKLSDFGLSAVRTSSTVSKTTASSSKGGGGLRWRAPECLTGRPSFASDVYSFAMCIIEAVLNDPPYGTLDDDSVRENIKNNILPDRPDEMPETAWELVLSMTKRTSVERITVPQMLEKLKVLADEEGAVHQQSENTRGCSECGAMTSDGSSICANCSSLASRDATPSYVPPAKKMTPVPESATNSATEVFSTILHKIGECSGEEKEKVLLGLVQCCAEDEQRAQLYESSAVQTLKDLVRNGRTYFTQLYALECLHWVSTADNRLAMSDFNALRDCVRDVSSEELAAAAGALQTTQEDGNAEAVIRCASIAARGCGDDLHTAGEELSSSSSTSMAGLWRALVLPLVTILRTGNDKQKLWTAEAIGSLALRDDDIRTEIARSDVIRQLVALLQVGTTEQKHRAAYALGNLAVSVDPLVIMLRKGAVTPLVTLIRDGTMQQKFGASHALENIVRYSYTEPANIAHESSIAQLVAILIVGTDEQKEYAARVLATFAKNDKQCEEIANQGGVASLVALLQAGTEDQKNSALTVLAGIAKQKVYCTDIVKRGAIKPLVELLQAGTNEQKQSAATVLEGCSYNDANCDLIAHEGGIVPLLSLLTTGTEKQQESAAVVLAGLSYTLAHCNAIARGRGVTPLVSLLRSGTDKQKYSAALALANLAGDDGSRTEVAKAGACSPLVALVQDGTDKQKCHAAFALGRLAWHNDANRVEIAQSGGVTPLVALLTNGTGEQKYYAAGALANLAGNATARLEITRTNCIAHFVTLLREGSDNQKSAAALALGNLSCDIDANRNQIARAGGLSS